MKRRLCRNRQVRSDLIAIYVHIAKDSVPAAEKVLDVIDRNVEALIDTPGVGRRYESSDPRLEGLRVAVVTPYRNSLNFFRAKPDVIEVFRIVHGAQELDRVVDEIQIDVEDE